MNDDHNTEPLGAVQFIAKYMGPILPAPSGNATPPSDDVIRQAKENISKVEAAIEIHCQAILLLHGASIVEDVCPEEMPLTVEKMRALVANSVANGPPQGFSESPHYAALAHLLASWLRELAAVRQGGPCDPYFLEDIGSDFQTACKGTD